MLLLSHGIELLHARHETAGEGGDRRHGQPKYIYWTHLAGVADLCAQHDWDRTRNGAVPGGMAEGDVGSSDGECWSDSEFGRTGWAQAESGWDRDARLRGWQPPSFARLGRGRAPSPHKRGHGNLGSL